MPPVATIGYKYIIIGVVFLIHLGVVASHCEVRLVGFASVNSFVS